MRSTDVGIRRIHAGAGVTTICAGTSNRKTHLKAKGPAPAS